MNGTALVNMSANSSALDDAARQRIVAAIVNDSADLVQRHTDEAGFAYEIGTNVVLARA